MQSVAVIIGFQSTFRVSFTNHGNSRSEGVVSANTLKRLVRKKNIKNIFFIKLVIGGGIRTPTDKDFLHSQFRCSNHWANANNGSLPAIQFF